MELKKIRMGIVGAGTWGQTHASIYAEHICADPVAICDSREERAREIADKYGIGKVYTDYHSLAADPDVDAVAIVTPDFAHADIAVAMANAGKDILIEKPGRTLRGSARPCGRTMCAAWWTCTTGGILPSTQPSRRWSRENWEHLTQAISATAM